MYKIITVSNTEDSKFWWHHISGYSFYTFVLNCGGEIVQFICM